MSSIIKHKVVDARHKWESMRLGKSCFEAKVADRSLKWQEVVSPSDKATWYSSAADNYGANVSDLVLLRSAAAQGDLNIVQTAWVGGPASARHRLLLGIKDATGQVSVSRAAPLRLLLCPREAGAAGLDGARLPEGVPARHRLRLATALASHVLG